MSIQSISYIVCIETAIRNIHNKATIHYKPDYQLL